MKKINKRIVSEIVAKILLEKNAITLNPKKPFRYASGILSPVYVDCRVIISFPKERKIIRDFYVESIISSKNKFDIIAGTATSGIPHAAWIADKLKLPMIYIRGKSKEYGRGNQIEGKISEKQEAAVIEDLVSTGESSLKSITAIRNTGGISSDVFSIITYGMKKSKEAFRSNKVRLTSLTNFKTVVSVACKQKYIKKNDQAVILNWIKDPQSWGKRMGFE